MLAFDPEPKYTSDHIRNPPLVEKGEGIILESGLIIIDNFLTRESCASLREWIDDEKNKEEIYTKWSEKSFEKKKICRHWDFPLSDYIIEIMGINKESVSGFYPSHINPCWRFVKIERKTNEIYSMSYHFDSKYIQSVDCISKYTVMIYLSDHNEPLEIRRDGCTEFIKPIEGRLLIFNQDFVHRAQATNTTKYFIRSEVMFKRVKPISHIDNNSLAMKFFDEAHLCYYNDPNRSLQLEKQAYQLSPLLEDIAFQ